jgi:DNA-binding NarL/FixJ family response regulator
MNRKINVVLVDDHQIVREGIRALLEQTGKVNVVGEASGSQALLPLIGAGKVDIVFMDISLDGESGLDLTALISRNFPAIRVIILSMYNSEDFVFNALKAGARAYLPKNTTRQELEQAMQEVMEGGSYFGEPVSTLILKSYMRMAREDANEEGSGEKDLTVREMDILRLFAEGKTNQEIAKELFISIRTVESHKNHIMRKLEIRSVVDLVKFAIRKGIIDV